MDLRITIKKRIALGRYKRKYRMVQSIIRDEAHNVNTRTNINSVDRSANSGTDRNANSGTDRTANGNSNTANPDDDLFDLPDLPPIERANVELMEYIAEILMDVWIYQL